VFRILVIDDNVTNPDVTSRTLQKAGYGVSSAETGEATK
jgi:CheY-like chemotaxis protein